MTHDQIGMILLEAWWKQERVSEHTCLQLADALEELYRWNETEYLRSKPTLIQIAQFEERWYVVRVAHFGRKTLHQNHGARVMIFAENSAPMIRRAVQIAERLWGPAE
jgi:hypothetical protein